MIIYDIAILGGGAAGLFCSSLLAQRGFRVIVVEGNKVCGRKILVSGGGRCNFTNIEVGFHHFRSDNPHFSRSALSTYTPEDFLNFVKKNNIDYYEKKLGQLFCRKSSQEILKALLKECEFAQVEISTGRNIEDLNILEDEGFEVVTSGGERIKAKKVVIATGGKSFSKLGATDIGQKIGKKFGHKIIPLVPALVPLKLSDPNVNMAGLSLPVEIEIDKKKIRDDLLFTHKGISGPAVLKASLYWERRSILTINFLPDENFLELTAGLRGNGTIGKLLKEKLPNNFVKFWFSNEILNRPISEISKKNILNLNERIHSYGVLPTGTEGFERAEVTRGGIDTKKISSKTMESQLQSGLYFIGEVLDVTGELGGYNFQWAWSSAFAMAKNFH